MEITQRTIQQAQQGNSKAISQIYETYLQRIYRYVAYRVNDERDIEDITAEVFIKMIEALPSYQITGAPFEAWLYRIAYSRIIDMRRKRTRHPQEDLPERMASEQPTPEQNVLDEQADHELRSAFSSLKEDDQNVLYLRFVEGKTHKEVAKIVNKSVTAVKATQHRALTRLANLLGQEKMRHYFRGDHD